MTTCPTCGCKADSRAERMESALREIANACEYDGNVAIAKAALGESTQ